MPGWSLWVLGEACMMLGELDEAIELLNRALIWAEFTCSPELSTVLTSLSQANFLAGDWEQAIAHGERGIEVMRSRGEEAEDSLAGLLQGISKVYARLRYWDKAISCGAESVAVSNDEEKKYCYQQILLWRRCRVEPEEAEETTPQNKRMCRVCHKVGNVDGCDGSPMISVCARSLCVYYCSAECQAADWKKHKPACYLREAAKCCHSCSEQPTALLKCGRCKTAQYCNATCQKAHWTAAQGRVRQKGRS